MAKTKKRNRKKPVVEYMLRYYVGFGSKTEYKLKAKTLVEAKKEVKTIIAGFIEAQKKDPYEDGFPERISLLRIESYEFEVK